MLAQSTHYFHSKCFYCTTLNKKLFSSRRLIYPRTNLVILLNKHDVHRDVPIFLYSSLELLKTAQVLPSCPRTSHYLSYSLFILTIHYNHDDDEDEEVADDNDDEGVDEEADVDINARQWSVALHAAKLSKVTRITGV